MVHLVALRMLYSRLDAQPTIRLMAQPTPQLETQRTPLLEARLTAWLMAQLAPQLVAQSRIGTQQTLQRPLVMHQPTHHVMVHTELQLEAQQPVSQRKTQLMIHQVV